MIDGGERQLWDEAKAALNAGDDEKAIDRLKQLSDSGDWRASVSLGYLFEARGKRDRTNFIVAAHWYSRAVTQEDRPEPHLRLARYYYFGLNGTWNYKLAFEHLKKARPEENPEAALMMSELFLNGVGVGKDLSTARQLLLSLADLGYPAGHLGLWRLEWRGRRPFQAIVQLVRYFSSAIALILRDRNDPRLVGTGRKHGDYRRDGFANQHGDKVVS